jgi:hypothetical protein
LFKLYAPFNGWLPPDSASLAEFAAGFVTISPFSENLAKEVMASG